MSQYDSLDEKYMRTQDLPSRAIAAHSIKKTMGDVNGLRVLDLACGYGFHMSCMRKYGASKVVGVDISEAMIRAAMELRGDDAAFEYRVGDCTKPAVYETEDGKKGDFDVVHGAWLLNYASNEEELVGMWRTVHDNLKPGGKFVALGPNLDKNLDEPLTGPGTRTESLQRVEHGHRVRTTFLVDPPFSIEEYRLSKPLYERCAAKAGMEDFKWVECTTPQDMEGKDAAEMEQGRLNMSIVTAARPG